MSRQARLTTAGVAVLVSLASISLVTGAFTPSEKTTIKQLRQRIATLEATDTAQAADIAFLQDAVDGIVGDLDIINENQLILSNDIDIIDAGLSGLVADEGPLAQIDRNLLMTQEIVFANHPPIALTDILPIVLCDTATCTVDVEWNSEPPATGQVEWGLTEEYGNLTGKEEELLGYHKQRIGTFPADGTVYHYRVIAELPEGGSAETEGTVTVG